VVALHRAASGLGPRHHRGLTRRWVRQARDNGNFAQALRARPIDPTTDYVIIQGGLNDKAQSPTAVAAGVRAVLGIFRAQALTPYRSSSGASSLCDR
jgi:hypothetical protein